MLSLSGIVLFVGFLYSVILHELAHGYVALSFGDETAKRYGRLTLNPIAHLDLFGSIILPLMLFLGGSSRLFGFAKPVPVNFDNFRGDRRAIIATSLAGIAMNLVLAVVLAAAFRIAIHSGAPTVTTDLFANLAAINLMLAFFNLIPVPGFDGSRILYLIAPRTAIKLEARMASWGPSGLVVSAVIAIFVIMPLILPVLLALLNLMLGVS